MEKVRVVFSKKVKEHIFFFLNKPTGYYKKQFQSKASYRAQNSSLEMETVFNVLQYYLVLFVFVCKNLRRPGIEPGSTAWKAAMLTTIPPTPFEGS